MEYCRITSDRHHRCACELITTVHHHHLSLHQNHHVDPRQSWRFLTVSEPPFITNNRSFDPSLMATCCVCHHHLHMCYHRSRHSLAVRDPSPFHVVVSY
ncbi:LOW QUALITY PROTEIN: hypothetical protein YC2023_012987 [Brassica napus]